MKVFNSNKYLVTSLHIHLLSQWPAPCCWCHWNVVMLVV